MFVDMLRRKAESADDGTFVEVGTRTTRLSQTCVCGRQQKKKLSQRIHECSCGVRCQRDLFSAYLACFVEEGDDTHVLDAGRASKAWPRSESAVQTAHQDALKAAKAANIIVGSFGRRPDTDMVDGSSGRVGRTQSGSSAPRTHNAENGDDVTGQATARPGEGSEKALPATGTP